MEQFYSKTANEYTQRLGHASFKAGSGRLINCKKTYNVVFWTVCGQSTSVNINNVQIGLKSFGSHREC